jgi:hypothetical protein
VLVLLLQPWVGTSHAVAMAMGTEICTTFGTQWVDGQGKALDGAKHDGHDGCCSGAAGMTADLAPAGHGNDRQCTPAESLAASRHGAEWLAPLSRGPPPALLS